MGNDFIVAIELGSSRIAGIAGTKNPDGSMQILAYCKEDSSTFMRKGMVYNIDKTAQCLSTIVNTLQLQLHSSISKVYVGIGGNALRTIQNRVPYKMDEEKIITQEIIDSIIDENVSLHLPDMEILDVVPQEYKVGLNLQTEPIGILSNNLEGYFLNVLIRSSIKRNIETCFEKANIEVSEYFISPKATAEVVLTDAEKRSGCALIDFGAETTTVSVYKNNVLRFIATIPLGGNNITRDIMTERIEDKDADMLKIKYGQALLNLKGDESDDATCSFDDGKRSIPSKLLGEIIEARMQEIIANVWNQLEQSGYKSELISGLILTGGASNMRDLVDAIKQKTGFNGNIKIMKTPASSIKLSWNEMPNDGTINTLIGLLTFGKEHCGDNEPIIPHNVKVESLIKNEVDDYKETSDMIVDDNSEEDKRREKLIKEAQIRDKEKLAELEKEAQRNRQNNPDRINEASRKGESKKSMKQRFRNLMDSFFTDTEGNNE